MPAVGTEPTLHIRLLGGLSLTHGDGAVTAIHSPRLHSLLGYLLLHRDTPQLRQHLAFTFWPDSSEAQARNNLRQILHELRHALPDAERFLVADRKVSREEAVVAYDPVASASGERVKTVEAAAAAAKSCSAGLAASGRHTAANHLCGCSSRVTRPLRGAS